MAGYVGILGAAAAAPPAWTDPTDANGTVKLWLDADDASTFTLTGSDVDQWDDKGPAGRTFTPFQLKPARTGSQNGLTTVTFATNGSGSRTGLIDTGTDSDWQFLHDSSIGTGKWLAGIVYAYTGGTYACPFGNAGGGGVKGVDALTTVANQDVRLFASGASDGSIIDNTSSSSALTSSTYHCVIHDVDLGNGTAANRSSIYVDGGSAIANNAASGSSTSAPTGSLMIGGRIDNGADPVWLTGAIGELVIIQDPSGSDRTDLETYLMNRWAI